MRAFFTILFCLLCTPCIAKSHELNVYNWSGLMPQEVIKQFEKETGINVNYSEYDNNESMYAKLKATDGRGYDIVFPGDFYVKRMAEQGLLKKLDKSKLPNIKYLDKHFLGLKIDPNNDYSLPYVWSTAGILVNKKFIDPTTVTRFSDLWQPRFKNQLLIVDEVRDIFSVALLTLGYRVNDTNPDHLQQAYLQLQKLSQNVRLYNSVAVANIFIDEDVHIGVTWSGDASVAQDENPNLVYIYPKEGFVIELDCMAIIKNADNLENAYQFLNFIMRPEISAKITAAFRYPTANLQAIKLLPQTLRNNPILNPDKKTLARGQFQTDMGKTNAVIEKYWERLRLAT